MEILRTENLCKSYGEGLSLVKAVDDISLTVEKGEFVAVVGASGSGKSTLMHLLGGVDTPVSGKIIIDGSDITQMNPDELAVFRRRHIGIVYQFYNLIPVLTVEENIMLPWKLDGRKADESRLEELMKAMGIENRRGYLPNELSGGQQQRVSIARALINEPALLLCDEPTGNLDSKSGDAIMEILRLANREYGQTIIMITHDPKIAAGCDRVISIQDGRLREV